VRRGSDAMRHLSLRPLSSKQCAGAVCAGSSHTFEVCKWTGYEYVRLAGSPRPQSAGCPGDPPLLALDKHLLWWPLPPVAPYKTLLLRLP
jgi:hypothetical protein